MYSNKRRRLTANNTVSTLTKPFRSPLIRTTNRQTPSTEAGNESSQVTDTTNAVADVIVAPDRVESRQQTTASSPPAVVRRSQSLLGADVHAHSSPSRPSCNTSPISIRRNPHHDAEYLHLQRAHSTLTNDLKKATASVDITAQALQRLSSSQLAELTNLVQRWRTISRDAAEELFAIAKDRVNRMGGVGVFRERYAKRNDFEDRQWPSQQIDEDELTSTEKEQLEIMRDEARREEECYKSCVMDEQKVQDSEKVEGDDDSFTIGMMLKSMNVDLEAIGYDEHAQRWAD